MRASAGLVAVAALLSAAAAHAQGDKSVKDWSGVCNNIATCAAFGFSPEGDDNDSYVRITRAGGPDAAPSVLVVFDAPDNVAGATWTLSLDGKPVAGIGPIRAAGSDQGARARLTGAAAQALIAAMRNGQILEIRQAGKVLVGVSLAGSAAILLWVDDQQGRVGTVTALARPGSKPASVVPAPPPTPLVAAAPPADQSHLPPPLPMAKVTAVEDCVASDAAEDSTHLVARLAPGVILWGPLCSLGAYNEVNVFFVGDEHGGNLKRVSFPEPQGAPPDDELMNVSFDPKARTLSSDAKGRGLGDCGSEATWVWDGQAFQLLSETEIDACRGVLPDDWPSRYVARMR